MKEHILVLDVGSSSMRGVLFDVQGQQIGFCQWQYTPEFFGDGRVEQDPDSWLRGMRHILSHFSEHTKTTFACIALTAARSSVIPVDAEGHPLSRAIMWQDRRSADIVDAYAPHADFIYDRTGIRFTTLVSVPKMLWIQAHQPELYARTHRFSGVQDLLIHALTGEFVTDHSFGSRSAVMNLQRKAWDDDLLALYQLDEQKLCTLIPPGSICGRITRDIATQTGIREGTPVITAGGDQQCAAIGQGVFTQRDMVISTGTGAYLVQGLHKAIIDPQRRFFCGVSPLKDQYILEASVLTGGSMYRWFMQLRSAHTDLSESELYSLINGAVTSTPAGSRGVVLLPWFEGRGSPCWNLHTSGAFLNISLATTHGDMARAILEGIALEFRENKEQMEQLAGSVTRLCVTGGMSVLPAYNQLVADCLNTTLWQYHEKESTAAGAWMVAVSSLGLISSCTQAFQRIQSHRKETVLRPDVSRSPVYQKMWEKRRKIYRIFMNNDFFIHESD